MACGWVASAWQRHGNGMGVNHLDAVRDVVETKDAANTAANLEAQTRGYVHGSKIETTVLNH